MNSGIFQFFIGYQIADMGIKLTEISRDEIERAFSSSFTKKELAEIAKEHSLKGLSKLRK